MFNNITYYINLCIYIQLVCYLDFQKLEKDLENFFLAVTRLILEKNTF